MSVKTYSPNLNKLQDFPSVEIAEEYRVNFHAYKLKI